MEPGKLLRTDIGKLSREINACVCKWLDRSLMLHVGKEGFDFDEMPI